MKRIAIVTVLGLFAMSGVTEAFGGCGGYSSYGGGGYGGGCGGGKIKIKLRFGGLFHHRSSCGYSRQATYQTFSYQTPVVYQQQVFSIPQAVTFATPQAPFKSIPQAVLPPPAPLKATPQAPMKSIPQAVAPPAPMKSTPQAVAPPVPLKSTPQAPVVVPVPPDPNPRSVPRR